MHASNVRDGGQNPLSFGRGKNKKGMSGGKSFTFTVAVCA